MKIGDTITNAHKPASEPLPGFKRSRRWSSAASTRRRRTSTPNLREALGKLQLNDAPLFYEPESSVALGFGFRCGFLGLLHMEIVQERLRREYQMDIIATYPASSTRSRRPTAN